MFFHKRNQFNGLQPVWNKGLVMLKCDSYRHVKDHKGRIAVTMIDAKTSCKYAAFEQVYLKNTVSGSQKTRYHLRYLIYDCLAPVHATCLSTDFGYS